MGDSPNGADRRQHERIPARIEVRFQRVSEAARAFRAYSLNFSAGGLCVKTTKAHAIGDSVRISMKVEGEDFDLVATVAWCRQGAVGLRFDELSDSERARLEAISRALAPRRSEVDV